MDREELRELLAAEGTEAGRLAADGLANGAEFDKFSSGHTVYFAALFGRRHRTVVPRSGQYTVGMAAAVATLKARREPRTMMGFVNDRPRSGLLFTVFMNLELTELVACFAIEPPSEKGRFPRPDLPS